MRQLYYTLIFTLIGIPLFAQIKMISGLQRGSYNMLAVNIQQISQAITVETSDGSAENLEILINAPDPVITFLQYDVLLYQKHKDQLKGINSTQSIRIALPLGYEEIHLITLARSPIESLADLKGKKVAVGSKGQGTAITAATIKRLTRTIWLDIPLAFEEAFDALLDGEVDAMFYVGYAPANKLYRLTPHTDVKLVAIEDDRLEGTYIKTKIPSGAYKWLNSDVATYGVASVLAVNLQNDTPEQQQYVSQLLIDIRDNISILQDDKHPNWKNVNFDFNVVAWPEYDISKNVFK